jgi:putative transposase|tara:strand:+ start:215 stop:433 length:219 start_codon:yes stop_codon:yes gene_type:complete
MHHTQSEKMEIIRLVEQSDTGVTRTLKDLKVHKTTFYKWYNTYLENGYDGLARKQNKRCGGRNKKTKRIETL